MTSKVTECRLSAMTIRIRVNGSEHDVTAAPDTPLLYVLRNDLSLNGPKFGCGLGQCGACTVHVDGTPRRSCVTALTSVAGRDVVTLEGLGTIEHPHAVQQAFIDEQAAQCGYCINGMIMRAAALLARTPRPSRDDILSAMDANLCGCGTHMRIVRAIERAAARSSWAPACRPRSGRLWPKSSTWHHRASRGCKGIVSSRSIRGAPSAAAA